MRTRGLIRSGRSWTAFALAMTAWLSLVVAARPSDNDQYAEADDLGNRNGVNASSERPSDLLIETQNISGKIGIPLPLKIKLVRVRNVYIEAIKLLGLPRGVTISDSRNIYSSSSDNNDVDVSAWDLSKIQITQSDPRENRFSLAVAVIWTPESGGHIDVTSSRLSVDLTSERRPHVAAAAAGINETPEPEQHEAPTRSEALTPQIVAKEAVANPETPVAEGAVQPLAQTARPGSNLAISRSAPSHAAGQRQDSVVEAPHRSAAAALPQKPTVSDFLVERAKSLIRRGDISGARLLLERAQTRHEPNATYLLAQTWDPAMLRTWKVRGLRADPDLARNLYAKASLDQQSDERLLAATGR